MTSSCSGDPNNPSNFCIEDYSPLIQYDKTWFTGQKTQDMQSAGYSGDQSFHVTSNTGGTASFSWNGTGVEIVGAKRANHGYYSVNLDGSNVSTTNGFSPGDSFQQSLYSQSGLTYGPHTVQISLVDGPGKFLDIDFIRYNTSDTAVEATANQTLTISQFTYQAGGQWNSDLTPWPKDIGKIFWTPIEGASVTVMFQGTDISMFGAIGTGASSYAVELDRVRDPHTYNSTRDEYAPHSLLYHAGGLPNAQHNLTLIRTDPVPGKALIVEFANVATIEQKRSASKLSSGAIAGIVVGAVAAVGLLGLAFFFFLRRRRAKSPDLDLLSAEQAAIPTPYGISTEMAENSALEGQACSSQPLRKPGIVTLNPPGTNDNQSPPPSYDASNGQSSSGQPSSARTPSTPSTPKSKKR